MDCEEARRYLPLPDGADDLPEETARRVADHVDSCPDCERLLSEEISEALERVPVRRSPSARRVLSRARARRLGFALVGAAAVLLAAVTVAGLLDGSPPPAPAPDLMDGRDAPRFASLELADRRAILAESGLAQYLHFICHCINRPTDADRRAYLRASLDLLREKRPEIRRRLAATGPDPAEFHAAATELFNDVLRAADRLQFSTIPNRPLEVVQARLQPSLGWEIVHLLGPESRFRLQLAPIPDYLNVMFLRIALEADADVTARIEEAVWYDLYRDVRLEPWRGLSDRDAYLAPRAEEAIAPLLSPRQRRIFRETLSST